MIWLRNALFAAIAVVSFLLFLEWNKFQETHQTPVVSSQETLPSTVFDSIPTQASVSADSAEIPNTPEQAAAIAIKETTVVPAQLVSVKTDTIEVLIDTHGGDIVKVGLLKHLQAQNDEAKEPILLLNRTGSQTYIAQSGLIGTNGTDKGKERPVFNAEQLSYQLSENDDTVTVNLYLSDAKVDITKRFTFTKNSYIVDVEYLINNRASSLWQAHLYGQIKRDAFEPKVNSGPGIKPFLGAATTTNENHFEKFDLDDIADEQQKFDKQGGWVAMIQHYFISAWVPNAESKNAYSLRKDKNADLYYFSFTSEKTTVEPNSQGSIKAQFYAGPKDIRVLEALSPYLDLTVDYGWLWFIAKPLFFGLDAIHSVVGNWGLAIILLTAFIKALLFYPSAMSYRSMAKMKRVQPLVAELKERIGDDKQRMSQEMMKLYKKEKVNPLGGCLPIALQMPVFISLYWMIMETVELRHSPFIFWITDLSVKDPFFVLPLIMGATMFLQQRLNPAPPDPMQAKVMQLMPVIFTAMFLFFPSGLVLYWVVNNTLSITQQWFITRQLEKADEAKAK